jgi:hypothetical protein
MPLHAAPGGFVMTVAILVALLAGALSLGVLSAVSFRRRDEIELDDGCLSDEELFDLGGPVIDLEAQR